MKRLLYIRSGPYPVNLQSYNLQEIGLCKAFTRKGYDCTVLYYSKKNDEIEIKCENDKHITVLLRHGVRLLRSGIYFDILKHEYLDQFSIIIISEYSQIMAPLLCKLSRNVYIYHGPYYNLFKIPITEPIYNCLFSKYINQRVQKVFVKTYQAQRYLRKCGITNTVVTGVGLDVDAFENGSVQIEPNTLEIVRRMQNHRVLLYVGSFIKRKNVELIVAAFNGIKEHPNNEDVQLLMIGNGNKGYVEHVVTQVSNKARTSFIHIPFLKNSQLKFIYPAASIFLMPSTEEIWGMSIMESMYFGIPPIASGTAGACTMMKDGETGFIVDTFNISTWIEKINYLLSHYEKCKEMGQNARMTIQQKYNWDTVTDTMERYFTLEQVDE